MLQRIMEIRKGVLPFGRFTLALPVVKVRPS
jgi:hypothetical protein